MYISINFLYYPFACLYKFFLICYIEFTVGDKYKMFFRHQKKGKW